MAMRRLSPLLPLFLVALQLHGQQPVPELPRVYIDSSYHRPQGSTIIVKHGEDLQAAFDSASPGDTILLEKGATFTGNFLLPPKRGNGWIYIASSAMDRLASPGQRTSPAEAIYMPKIHTRNTLPAISVLSGAANYRLIGLEIAPAAGAPRVYQLLNIDVVASQLELHIRRLIHDIAPSLLQQDPLPQNIVIDRCYIHGSDTQDVRHGIVANGTAVAVIDSYISEIHDSTVDSQGISVYHTFGPIKIVNNFISATTENVMFGGGRGVWDTVPSDIEIRRNWLYKPLSWIAPTTSHPARWAVKNDLEFKNARRVVVSGNLLENDWVSGQRGYAVVLTPRTSDSGNLAVVDDITIESNVLKDVTSGFNSLAADNLCKPAFISGCTNPGEATRWKIANNLILLRNPGETGGARNVGFGVAVNLSDVIFQHNTIVPATGTTCWASLYFSVQQGAKWPLAQSDTHNLWVLDNVLCRQPTGDWGGRGTTGMTSYMSEPAPLADRFWGNVMLVPKGDGTAIWPAHNHATTLPLTYIDPGNGDYQLLTPNWTDTTGGEISGIDWTKLQSAMSK